MLKQTYPKAERRTFAMKFHILSLLAILLVSGVAASPTQAALDEHMPADTLVYAHWAGRSLTFDGSMFGQMIAEPGFGNMYDVLIDTLRKNMDDEKEKLILGRALAMGKIAWPRPIAIGLTALGPNGQTSAALWIDLGKNQKAFDQEFTALLELLGLAKNRKTLVQGMTTYYVLAKPKNPSIVYGYVGELFFLTLGEPHARTLIDLTPAKSLKANPTYQSCRKDVAGPNEQMGLYVNIAKLRTSIISMEGDKSAASEEVSHIIDALGLGKAAAMAGTVRIVEKGMYTKMKLFTPAPHQGVLLPFAGAPLTAADLAGIPADADFAIAGNVSPTAVMKEIRRIAALWDEKKSAKASSRIETMLNAAMEEFYDTLGISFEKDLLASLGDTWVLSSAQSQGGLLTGTVLSVEVVDEKKLAATLTKLEALLPSPKKRSPGAAPDRRDRRRPRLQTLRVKGTSIRYLRMPRGEVTQALLPAWAIHDGRLYLAAWPQVIASTLENKANQTHPTQPTKTLLTTPDYKTLRAKVSPNASGLIYCNTPQIARQFYAIQLIFGTILSNEMIKNGVADSMPLMPGSIASVTKYMIPSIDVVHADETGITFEGYSSGPSLGAALPVIVGAGAAIAVPAAAQARKTAREAQAATHLHILSTAVFHHRAEHNNKYPSNFKDLMPYIKPAHLVNPKTNRKLPTWDPKTKTLTGKTDYALLDYSKIKNIPSESKALLLYENPANYADGSTWVVYLDGHVKKVSIQTLRRLLDTYKKLVAEK